MLNDCKCDRERVGYTNDHQNLFHENRSNTVLIVE